ncbi:unnamed protein product [Closterium sp. NIES-65]|nr:unnamed protein product [Closterium sp. NIES-65]
MQLLISAFNPAAVGNVMCTNLINIDWQGALFDCDFNQQLALGLPPKPSSAPNSPLSALHSYSVSPPLSKPPGLLLDMPIAGKAPSSTGALFDCDFNQQLNLSLPPKPSTATNSPLAPPPPPPPRSVFDIQSLEELVDRPIATAAHCFG